MTNWDASIFDFVIRHSSFSPHVCSVKIRFTKRTDGGARLNCVRADGSTTWQRQDDKHAAFFPLHDLTHYARD